MTQEELKEIADLEAERVNLVAQATSIDASLSQKRRYDPDGTMWNEERYHTWRSSAVHAKMQVNKKLLRVKSRLKELKDRQHAEAQAAKNRPDPTRVLICRAHRTLVQMREDGVEMDSDELALIDDLNAARDLGCRSGACSH